MNLVNPDLPFASEPDEKYRFIIIPISFQRGPVGLPIGSVHAQIGLRVNRCLGRERFQSNP